MTVRRRLVRLERAKSPRAVRGYVSTIPYNPDGTPPTLEEIEAAAAAPMLTPEEWEAIYCKPRDVAPQD